MKKYIIIFLAVVGGVWSAAIKATTLLSLCDEWNVMEVVMGPSFMSRSYVTKTLLLTTDTVIHNIPYVKVEQKGEQANGMNAEYMGAMREDDSHNIYFIPSESTREYLLYAFDAKIGDVFTNVWCGGTAERFPEGCKVTITNIRETEPATYDLSIEYAISGGEKKTWDAYFWIKGVGFSQGPQGPNCPFDCAGGPMEHILCAQKNGVQIYRSELGDEYGCEYYDVPVEISLHRAINLTQWDGITGVTQASRDTLSPIEAKDAGAYLSGHYLDYWDNYYSMYEGIRELQLVSLDNQEVVYEDKDFAIATIHMETPGSYMLIVKQEYVEGLILGRVDFETGTADIGSVSDSSFPPTKFLRDGQILILRGDRTYTLTGQEVK